MTPRGADDLASTEPVLAGREAARRLRLGGDSSGALDRLAGLAARLLGTASSQVSLLTDVQTVAGGAGLALAAVGADSALADSLCTVTAASGGPLVVQDAATDPRVAHLPPVSSGAVGSYLGVPLVADDGSTVGAMCVFDPLPRTWSPEDVALLQQLASSAIAELELTALTAEHETARVLWELAIDAAGIGTFDWDLGPGRLTWDERLLELFGIGRDEFEGTIEAFNARVHPDDLPRVERALQTAIDTGGVFQAEYRVVLPDGAVRWVDARGRALLGPDGTAVRLLGAAYDSTLRQEQEARVRHVLESMSAAFYSLDTAWRFTYVNAEAERLLGRPREELLGGLIWDLFPAASASAFEVEYRRAVETGQPVVFDAYYPAPLDGWYELRAWPTTYGLSVYFLDVTARRRAQEQAAAQAARAALRDEVTTELTGTLDVEIAVARLARLVVPALADWCVISLVDADQHADWRRRLRDVGAWHVDPDARPLVEHYRELRLSSLREDAFIAAAARDGRVAQVRRDATAFISGTLAPGAARDLLVALAPDSAVALPLPGRGRTVGLLSLYNGADRGPIGPLDLQAAKDVAGRAGLALDNSRLYQEQRQLAEGLQRSLLTEPPAPDHAHVVVRYEPAAETAQVGGDWYDAFLQPDGATMIVIGDVIGHDTVAAAAMGQVRGLLRGVAADSGAGPADLLRRVDRVMQVLQVDTTATALVARLEQTPQEREQGVTRLRWSNAGHPPPLVVTVDGHVVALPEADADLLLGIDPDVARGESEVALERGATVLLYTDGLVERRGQSLDDGLARLRATLADLVREPLTFEELCDALLVRMLPERPEDDVALVAVRLHPQHRPRPAEAGPNRLPDGVAPEPG